MKNEIILYQTDELPEHIEVRLDDDTVWLSLNQIAQLFNRDKSVISRHLRNIYSEGELTQEATVAKNATVQIESGRKVKREIEYYNLDAILSVGYRVNSKQGTQFRIWATNVLRDYLLKGYAQSCSEN
ncbi:virulence RhuM family protein [Perlabentimonas gracilis]|uniref:virulence RhuM family protein n=1 Tax=Perlabentimonas gracilis TaxID=2715279 RepID=UPI001407C388|nr:helix-turn-helix domain-containing protein [Perlabentimonas gracilis]NHB70406.1 virulence factor [Perlabentimonas gracilis]